MGAEALGGKGECRKSGLQQECVEKNEGRTEALPEAVSEEHDGEMAVSVVLLCCSCTACGCERSSQRAPCGRSAGPGSHCGA